MKSNQFNEDYYNTDGYDTYLKDFKEEGKDFVKRLLSKIELKLKANILDVGCGMGGVIKAFRDCDFVAVGTEISDYCLKHSPVKKYLQKVGVTSLPFEDNYFDLVICQDVLCYLDRKQIYQAVKELVGVTKQYLYIEVISKGSPNSKQSVNPDRLRKSKNLLTKQEWFKVFCSENLRPLSKVYSIEDNPDFNYMFLKQRK